MVTKIVRVFLNIISILLIVFSLSLLFTVVLTGRDEAPQLMGFSMFRVLTGSMEPEIPENSVIITKNVPFDDIRVDDVISFYSEDPSLGGMVNTHRVTEITEDEQGTIFITKGDANVVEDNYPVHEQYFIGKVIFCTSFLGLVVRLTSNPFIFVPLIAVPLLYFVISNIIRTVKIAKELSAAEEKAILEQYEARRAEEEKKKSESKENSESEQKEEQED